MKTIRAGASAGQSGKESEVLYTQGLLWNRSLPGVAGALRLGVEMRTDLTSGIGFGTVTDPLHLEWNAHFAIQSVKRETLRDGTTRLTMTGIVTEATDSKKAGQPVRLVAEVRGDAASLVFTIGGLSFGGLGLVVIAIIAILIGS